MESMLRKNMKSLQYKQQLMTAIKAARAGGKIIQTSFLEAYDTQMKSDTSLQTTVDLQAENAIVAQIQQNFPDHSIVAEEAGQIFIGSADEEWRIDALDGTENFVGGIPYFSTEITYYREATPTVGVVFNPITNDLYYTMSGEGAWLNGQKISVSQEMNIQKSRAFFIPDFGTKRQLETVRMRDLLYTNCRRVLDTWSPALDWCLVACGRAELLLAIAGRSIRPGAGMLILQEAGGVVTDLTGNPIGETTKQIIAGNKEVHASLLQMLLHMRDICHQ